ncbi:MAG TPA: hypothetical protein VG328_23285 [Stellaceae bacterium]|nr:hypothetical protein [Stellaceae bacterium]
MFTTILTVLKPYSDLITGFASVAVALFTGVLVFVTNRQATLTRQALTITQRAFVFVEDFDDIWVFQSPSAGTATAQGFRGATEARFNQFTIKPRWKNNGTTPTRNMLTRINWTHKEGSLPKGFSYEYGAPPENMFLPPQGNEWSAPIRVPANVATDALNGRTRIYIWGRVDYDDIFRGTRPHFTSWCYEVRLSLNAVSQPESQYVAIGSYNQSEEGLAPV